ncbi:MAG: hypothetical protein IPL53_19745 [Ignavibacteria bacterium]|nr:hypothetical protein [Ignavibacteria bacterium]
MNLFEDIIEKNEKHLTLMENCHWLKQGDLIVFYESEEMKVKILQKDKSIINSRLYKVAELNRQVDVNKESGKENEYGVIKLSYVKN